MGAKVKISADLMERVMAGTLSGPDAAKVEELRRHAAKLRRKAARFVKAENDCRNEAKAADAKAREILGEPEPKVGA